MTAAARLPLRPDPDARAAHLRAVALRLRHRRAHAHLAAGLFLGRATDAELDRLTDACHFCSASVPAGDVFILAVAERARRDWLDRDEGDA